MFQTEPLRSLPNGVKDSKDTKQHTRVGRVVLDGSETYFTWGLKNTDFFSAYVYKLRSNLGIPNGLILSDYFAFSNYTVVANATGTGCFTGGDYIGISVPKNILSDTSTQENALSSLKNWLSTHNAEFIYELKEEIIEPLTQNQATTMLDIIKTGSYEGTTNIYTDEDVKPTIGVGYYKKG